MNYRNYSKKYKTKFFKERNRRGNFNFYLFTILLLIISSTGIALLLIFVDNLFYKEDEPFFIIFSICISIAFIAIVGLLGKTYDDLSILVTKKLIQKLKKKNDLEILQNKTNRLLVSIFAIEAISEKYQEKSIDTLIIILKTNKFHFIRKRASYIIAEMGVRYAIEEIAEVLAKEKKQSTKFHHALQIAKLDKIKGIKLIEEMYENDKINDMYYNIYLQYFRNLLKDDVLNEERLRITLKIHDKDYMKNFVRKIISEEESKFYDFKTTYTFWQKEPKILTNKELEKLRREICLDIGSFANAEGGVIVIGISDKRPRRIIGLDKIESKKQSIIHIAKTYFENNIDFFEIIDIQLKDNNQNDKDCLLIIIAQANDVIAIKSENNSYKYPLRVTADKIYKSYRDISQIKKEVEKINYNFLKLFY